jgi:GNAT superfamily N-acetyltransferase
MSRDAVGMRLDLGDEPPPPLFAPSYQERAAALDDVDALIAMACLAYRGGVDDDPEEVHDDEIRKTFAGDFGRFDGEASRIAVTNEGAHAAAALVVHWDTRPLLANVMTHPHHRGHGLGAALIQSAARVLRANGESELVLVVTRGNPAEAVYRRLGFETWERPERAT